MSERPLIICKPVYLGLAVAFVLALAACSAGGRQSAQKGSGGGRPAAQDSAAQASMATGIKAMQEKAISMVQGGRANVPILWADAKSGLQGTLLWDSTISLTYSCRQYHQTVILGEEMLTGILTACPFGDGTWKLSANPSSS